MNLPSRRKDRRSESVSPILEQIMTGGSSVSFNTLQLSQGLQPNKMLFLNRQLNNCFIFKYPNFYEAQSDSNDTFEEMLLPESFVRPIETGLYVPYNTSSPRSGGYAVYMRSKNYRSLLHELFGVPDSDADDATLHDLAILNTIDNVPSLDAFLLKTSFETDRILVDPQYLRINAEEERQIRQLIGGRIEPIIRKALGIPDGMGHRVERFLQAIWDTNMPEARPFIAAFGIEHGEADAVFGAWKGITFYEHQLRRLAPAVRNIVKWLKSSDSLPIDLRSHKSFEENLLMYIERVGKLIENALTDIRSILAEYENCFRNFMDGTPYQFREFLRTVRHKYWLMGYCISALHSLVHTYNRFMRQAVDRRLFFESMYDMLRQFDVALDRRREQRAIF